MKISAGGGGEVSGCSRVPEVFGDEVDDALLLDLQGSGNAEEGSGFGQGGVPLEDHEPEDNLHEFGREITPKSSTGGGDEHHATDLTSSSKRSPISSSCTSRS
ncbi:hypothetical protein MELA_01267 [Candidatus Methylomirabilis lanthanidiphila]|uniref:Uncharacterized protein n=1 Tax=Candidatus Methylomirabilis lanthanidiphila TaxID=2211376 RepID=A0A564ZJT4_9BACT|nr:hypothetical protein MELA_01267 [Candidatus Methylomirabilis lanthanidiphila]